jgi:hypothetical protein
MFVGTAVVACGCYWLMLPTLNAQRFVAAVAAGDYAAADAFFADPADRFLEQCDTDYTIIAQQPKLEPASWRGVLCGRRQISLRIVYSTPTRTDAHYVLIMATPAGLRPPQRPHWPGGSGGGGIAASSRFPRTSAFHFPRNSA